MDNREQVANVKKALDLEKSLRDGRRDLAQLSRETFRECPARPVLQKHTSKYPPIDTKYPLWLKAAVFLTFPIVGLILIFVVFPKKEQEKAEAIKNSPEYIKQCADIDDETAKKQQASYAAYQEQTKRYEEVIVPEYEREKKEWESEHNRQIRLTKERVDSDEKELIRHYEETRIVPSKYRTIDALDYIFELMSSISDYDIKGAIERYDAEINRRHEMAMLQEQRRQNQLLDEKNAIEAQRNVLIDEQNEIAEKSRRDANIRGVISGVQQHNRNKYLKDLTKK